MRYKEVGLIPFRRELLKNPKKVFSNNDHRFQDTYYCQACGFPLVSYNKYKCDYSTKRSMYKIEYNRSEVYLCFNAKQCRDYRTQRKGTEMVKVLMP